MRFLVLLALTMLPPAMHGARPVPVLPVYGYVVVREYPHDPGAYTEGLLYRDGWLYEATGRTGFSSVRKVELDTGKVVQRAHTPWPAYGEGIAIDNQHLVQLTWRRHEGFIYDLATFKLVGHFRYRGEGWALTRHGGRLYMSDGTPTIRVLDAATLQPVGTIHVTAAGRPLRNINELEWVRGEIYANVWLTPRIARIDPATGKVVGWIDLSGLGPDPDTLPDAANDVLNGIAWDAAHNRLFVTGKCWPHVYQIRLVRRTP